MRRDIEIHIQTGDITLGSFNKITEYPFAWISNLNGLSRYIYGEIEVPATIPDQTIRTKGLCCTIPYTGLYKEFYIRVKRVYSENNFVYLQNPADGSDWFLVKTALYGGALKNAFASSLREISDGAFLFMFDKGIVQLYSASGTDFNIINANRQNANLMLACVPTNNYRYPVTGVGLVRWLKSSINSGLADTLQREFDEDGTPVISAGFDFETDDLQLQLDTTNVDLTN